MTKRIEIRCPIYGFIVLDEWDLDIIQHPAFQRLRRIRQLAWTDYVYPGAVHTRFEHTLGVMHMAGLLFARLTDSTNREIVVKHLGGNDDVLNRSYRVVRLAALLHDVGHAPFSHAAEELFPLKTDGTRWSHEEYSAEIIRARFRDVIDGHPQNVYGIRAAEIADLILGRLAGRMVFWRPLVSGQIDADRMDYLLRDSHHAGVRYGRYDWPRLVNTITVTPGERERGPQIGVTEGGWNAAEGLVVARYMMFQQIYYHKTRVILDHHLHHALAEILPGGTFPTPDDAGLTDYLAWDDWRVQGALAAGAGGEHGERLRARQLFKEIGHIAFDRDERAQDRLEECKARMGVMLTAALSSGKSWYKLDDTDIPVVSEDERRIVLPLSRYSPIIGKMGSTRIVRLYARVEDRAACAEIFSTIGRRGEQP